MYFGRERNDVNFTEMPMHQTLNSNRGISITNDEIRTMVREDRIG